MKVKCINHRGVYNGITVDRIYKVIPTKALGDLILILNDNGVKCHYPNDLFEVVTDLENDVKQSDNFLSYQPKMWSVLKDSILAAQDAILIGLENTQELLLEHDINFGRTTSKNRINAERLEGEIKQMQNALLAIKEPNVIM